MFGLLPKGAHPPVYAFVIRACSYGPDDDVCSGIFEDTNQPEICQV